jgi:hypothetical protein
MLFEESGLLLRPDEQVLKHGNFSGKIPVGPNLYVQNKAIWKKINGELVITDQRAFALERQGIIRKKIDIYDLEIVGVTVTKSLFGKQTLELMLNYGDRKAQRANLEVDNPIEWMNAMRGIVSR